MQRPRLSIDIHPDLGKNPARDEASTLGPRSDNRARWLKFAVCALHPHGATEEDIAELTNLARDEQETLYLKSNCRVCSFCMGIINHRRPFRAQAQMAFTTPQG